MLGKIRDKYQAYCTTYKTYTMATHHGSTGCPVERDTDSHIEDIQGIDIEPDNDNESTSSSDTTVAFGGSEADGCPSKHIPSNQAKLTALMREIHSLWQQVKAGEGQPAEGLVLSLTLQTQPTSTPTPMEPFGEVICQYTDTLCTTQKQTNLTHSLLQDIAVFNEYDSTELEQWLLDLETAADLTNESWAKLAKAKSRGLTHTLVMKAINSGKSGEEIKDLLTLKLCNASIHTYTLHFMDIQQQEKESLAAYVHQFKTKAKWCNFTNNAATIIISIKGPKNTHSLAAHIYEKGPQTLTHAIMEVEKLNAAQQLTTTIILSSAVNMMSNEEDWCFQCQEPGHITRHCPHIRCHECNEYGHIIMDCPDKIPPSGKPVTHHRTSKSHHTRSSSGHHQEDWERRNWSRSQSNYSSHCSLSQHDSHRGCSRFQHQGRHSHHRSSSQWSHSAHWRHRPFHDTLHRSHHTTHHSSSNYCSGYCSMTHFSSSGHHSQDCSRSHSQPPYCSSTYGSYQKGSHSSASYSTHGSHKSHHRRNKKVQIKEPQLDYYCLDNLSTDSEEESVFKIVEPSPSSDPHEKGGLLTKDHVTIALITDCPTIRVCMGKQYKALIDSEAVISLVKYTLYQTRDSSFKTSIQATLIQLNTANGSPMTALGMTTLQLRVADFKFSYTFIICDRLPEMELLFGIYIQKKFSLSYAWDRDKNCYIQREGKFLTYTRNCEQKENIAVIKSTLKILPRHSGIIPIKIRGHIIKGHMTYFISD